MKGKNAIVISGGGDSDSSVVSFCRVMEVLPRNELSPLLVAICGASVKGESTGRTVARRLDIL